MTTITAAIAQDLQTGSLMMDRAIHLFAQGSMPGTAIDVAHMSRLKADLVAAATKLNAALEAAGLGDALPATQTVIANGETSTVEPTGTFTTTTTFTVAGGVITAITLS